MFNEIAADSRRVKLGLREGAKHHLIDTREHNLIQTSSGCCDLAVTCAGPRELLAHCPYARNRKWLPYRHKRKFASHTCSLVKPVFDTSASRTTS